MIALKNVLVATDFSEPAQAALRYGVELARQFNATLHVVHVVDDLTAHPSTTPVWIKDLGALQSELESTARADLDALLSEPDRTSARAHLQVIVSAKPGSAILNCARDVTAELIVVGTHGRRGVEHLVFGSVAQHVARFAECPVLVVRAPERGFIVGEGARPATKAVTGEHVAQRGLNATS